MAFTSRCCCPQHVEWGYDAVKEPKLLTANKQEEDFCEVVASSRHKSRKRKLCSLCRERIVVEKRLKVLEDKVSTHNVECQVANKSEQTDNILLVNIGVQTAEQALKSYQESQERNRRAIRGEFLERIYSFASSLCNEDEISINGLLSDVLSSQKLFTQFKHLKKSSEKLSSDDKILKTLARDYQACKNQEVNREINSQSTKLKSKILIGNTLKDSKLVEGIYGDQDFRPKNRPEIASKLGRMHIHGDEKRRLLSIVANDFPYSVLMKYFQCANNTITAARVHATLFGRGGVPPPGLKFTRQVLSKEVIEELFEFLHRDDISRPSSCRSVIVNEKETGVRYWQHSIQDVVKQYLVEYPNGAKRSYIYTHLPKNFRTNTMLAGLCNICDDCGHSNFDELESLLEEIGLVQWKECARRYQRFLKTRFSKLVRLYDSQVHGEMERFFPFHYIHTVGTYISIPVHRADETQQGRNCCPRFLVYWLNHFSYSQVHVDILEHNQ